LPTRIRAGLWGTTGGRLLLIAFFIFLVLWMLGFLAFPVLGGIIHLLLIVAVVSLILHFSQDRAV
jgi:hypothetical protein